MKGLLLKDAYNVKENCITYFIMAAFFSAVSFMMEGDTALFWIFYPCVLTGMIPVNILSYDEHERWNVYERCLPYTARQIVASKYLVGLLSSAVVVVLIAVPQGIQALVRNEFQLGEFLFLIMVLVLCSLFTPTLILPFVFKVGAEKGRVLYYVCVGVIAGVCVALMNIDTGIFSDHPVSVTVVFGVVLIMYVISWRLSLHFYENREF